MMQQLAVWFLLALAVAACFISALGIALFRDIYARLHYLGLASNIGVVCIVAAIFVQKGLSQSSGEAALAALVVVVTSPVITHAIARAAYIREFGDLELEPKSDNSQNTGGV